MNSEATAVEQPKPEGLPIFFVKVPKCPDPKLEAELESAKNEILELEHTISQILENLALAKRNRKILSQNLNHLWEMRKDLEQFLNRYRNLMKPLHQALWKIGVSNTVSKTCSAEEQLDEVIKILESRMTHESIHLSEEKQIVREIDKLRGMESKCIACDARRAEIQNEIAYRDTLEPRDREKLIGTETDIISQELQLFKERIRQGTVQKKYIAKHAEIWDADLKILEERKIKAESWVQQLEREMNAPYENYCKLLGKAKKLAAEKNAEALKVLADSEVNEFMSLYSSDKEFRDSYVRRVLPSLDSRQLSRDGRRRNPNEKSVVVRETPEMVMKLNQEVSSSSDTSRNEETVELDKKIKEKLAKHKEAARQLQIATQNLAMLNKEEQAERRVAREAIRAEREAEEQQKNHDKRARRKARKKAMIDEVSSEGMELDQQAHVAKEQQVNPIKQARAKGPISIQKIIHERRKGKKIRAGAARAAAFLAVVVVLIACGYLF